MTLNAATLDILDTLDLGSVANGDFGQQIPRGVVVKSNPAVRRRRPTC